MPRYLQFARALALLSVGACGASAAPVASTSPTTSASTPADDRCSHCTCTPDSVNPPYCPTAGIHHCCRVVPHVVPGPLPPPELAAA